MNAKAQRRVGQVIGVFLGLGIGQVVLNLVLLDASKPAARAISTVLWLGLAICLALGVGLLVWQTLIGRRIDELASREIPWDSIPMNDEERRWDAELRWLGFRPLGCIRTQAPHGQAGYSWQYVDVDGRIGGEVNRLTGSADFFTEFVDGVLVVTRNRSLVPATSTPHYLTQNVSSPGNALAPAYTAHLTRLYGLVPIHGDGVRFNSIEDLLASDERSRTTILPEVMASGRRQLPLGMLVLVGLPAGVLAVLGLQILGV